MKFKRTIALLTAAASLAAMCGCAKTEESTAENTKTPADATAAAESGEEAWEKETLTITVDGKSFLVGGTETALKEAWGEPDSVEEAVSCMFDGYDRTLLYMFATVFTFPIYNDGNNIVDEIYVTSPLVTFKNGVAVGCTKEDVIKAYGDNYYTPEGSAMLTYNYSGDESLDQSAPKIYFYISGGVVTGIGVCSNLYHS